jgi:hypothetical protein
MRTPENKPGQSIDALLAAVRRYGDAVEAERSATDSLERHKEAPGATVLFNDRPAADVTISDDGTTATGTTPAL